MAENLNTLYYALELDDIKMQQQLQEAIENLSNLDKEFDKINKAIEDTFKKNVGQSPVQKEIKSLRAELQGMEKEWNNLTLAERRGAKGQDLRAKYEALRKEAGNLNNSLAKLYLESQKAASGQKGLAAQLGLVNNQLTLQNRIASNINTLFTTSVSIFAAKSLVQNLAQVRGEFENQQIALRAILRDAEAADKIFGQIKSFAVVSPFEFKDLVGYAKQLSAFQVPVDELFETTKRLADVSAGLGVGMDRIILAYGQVRSAAVLRGQELRQFTEAGIPLVDELAKKFSELEGRVVSAGDVFEKISNRMVSFEMVKEIFEDMTNEGGMFYMMQEKQAESLKGKIANLADAYDIMLNDIGEANDGILKGGVAGIAALFENWKKVWDILQAIIIAYGTYNTALIINNTLTSKLTVNTALLGKAQASLTMMTNGLTASRVGALRVLAAATAANNGYAAATAKAALSNNIFSKSFYKLSASVSANPIIAMITALVALGVVAKNVYDDYLDDLSSADKANERVANKMAVLNNEFETQKKQFNELSKVVKNQTILIDTQNKSFAELKQIYPDLFNNLQTEEQWYNAISEANEKRNKAIIKMKELFPDAFKGLNTEKDIVNSLTKAYDNLNRAQQEQMLAQLETNKKNIESSIQRIEKSMSGINYGGDTGLEAFRVQASQLEGLKNEYKSINVEINNIKKSLKDIIDFEEGWRQQIKNIAPNLYDNQQLKDFNNLSEALDDLRAKLEKYKNAEIDYKNIPSSQKTADTTREFNSLKNNISQAEAALKFFNAVLNKNKDNGKAPRVIALENEIKLIQEAEKAYEKLTRYFSAEKAGQNLSDIFPTVDFSLNEKGEADFSSQIQAIINKIIPLNREAGEKAQEAFNKGVRDKKSDALVDNVKDALDAITKEIDLYKSKLNIYEEILNLGGSEELALNLSGVKSGNFVEEIKEMTLKAVRKVNPTITIETVLDQKNLPEQVQKLVDAANKAVEEAQKNNLLSAAKLLTLDSPEGMGMAFDLGNIVKKYSVELLKLQNELRNALSAEGLTDEQKKQIEDNTKLAKDANTKIYADKAKKSGAVYAQEQIEIAGLGEAFKNMSTASYESLLKMLEITEKAKNDLISGTNAASGLKNVGFSDKEVLRLTNEESVFTKLFNSEDLEQFQELLEQIYDILNHDDDITIAEKLGIKPEDIDKLKLWIAQQKGAADAIDNTNTEINEFRIDKIVKMLSDLSKNLDGTINGIKNLSNVFGAELDEMTSGALDLLSAVVSSTTDVISTITSTTKASTDAIDSTATAASTAIKTVEKASVVLAVISAALQVATAIARMFSNDKKLDEEIRNSQLRVEKLKNLYSDIERTISRSLGGASTIDLGIDDVNKKLQEVNRQLNTLKDKSDKSIIFKIRYSSNIKELEREQKNLQAYNEGGAYALQRQNLINQQEELRKQIEAERSKKDTDESKITDYENQISELEDAVRHFAEDTLKSLYDIDLKDWASQIGDSLVEAFSRGENAVEAFDNTVGDIMRSVVKKMASLHILEPMFEELRTYLFGADGKSGAFGKDFELDNNEVAWVGNWIKELKDNALPKVQEFYDKINEATGGMLDQTGENAAGLSNGIKSITEDTAQLIASYMNAVRGSVLLQELYMKNIDTNVAGIYQAMGGNPNITTTTTLPPEIIAAISEPMKLNNSLLANIDMNMTNVHSIAANALAQLVLIQANTYNAAVQAKRCADYFESIIKAGHPMGGSGINVFA